MFNFKVIASSFPAICVVAATFMFVQGDSRMGVLLALLSFVSFMIPVIASKYK